MFSAAVALSSPLTPTSVGVRCACVPIPAAGRGSPESSSKSCGCLPRLEAQALAARAGVMGCHASAAVGPPSCALHADSVWGSWPRSESAGLRRAVLHSAVARCRAASWATYSTSCSRARARSKPAGPLTARPTAMGRLIRSSRPRRNDRARFRAYLIPKRLEEAYHAFALILPVATFSRACHTPPHPDPGARPHLVLPHLAALVAP